MVYVISRTNHLLKIRDNKYLYKMFKIKGGYNMLCSIQNAVEQKISLSLLRLRTKVKDTLVNCDGWFFVLMAVILSLAFTIYAGLAIWCVVYKGKHFTGKWSWGKWFIDMNVQCV